jgi:chorismate synthase
VGALQKQLLGTFGIEVGSFVTAIGGAAVDETSAPLDQLDEASLRAMAAAAEADTVRCPDPAASARMREVIDRAREEGETLGGIFVVIATGVPAGLGSYVHWDRKLDGRLAQAICSIPAVKGVEIGRAFELARAQGTLAQDSIVRRDGAVTRVTNRAAGLEAGVTNGMPLVIRAAMKPLSSVRAAASSVDFITGEAVDPPYVRSDVCAVPAAAVVGEAMVAWVLSDALTERLGGDRLDAMLCAWEVLRHPPAPADGSTTGRPTR